MGSALKNSLLISSGGQAFTPASQNPYKWLSGSTQPTGVITTWTDKGSGGLDATQTNASFKPTVVDDGGVNAVDFDTSARYMELNDTGAGFIDSDNNTDGFEVWTMIKMDSGQAGTPVYFGARTATKLYFQFFHGGSGKLRWFLGDTVGTDVRALTDNAVFPVGQTGWVLVRLVANYVTNQMEIHANGINMTLDATDDGDLSLLDFSQYSTALDIYLHGRNNNGTHDSGSTGMYLGDVVIHNRLLSTTEAQNLTDYFI